VTARPADSRLRELAALGPEEILRRGLLPEVLRAAGLQDLLALLALAKLLERAQPVRRSRGLK
jgi:hypothetical protein